MSLKASDSRPLTEANVFASATISRALSLGMQYANSNFRARGQGEGFGYRLQLEPSEGQIPDNASLEYRAPIGIYELNLDRNSNGKNITSN